MAVGGAQNKLSAKSLFISKSCNVEVMAGSVPDLKSQNPPRVIINSIHDFGFKPDPKHLNLNIG